MSLHHIDVPGVTLHVDDIGTGEPLLFLSGLLCDSTLFEHQAGALSRHARVIRMDWRGHGYSTRPKGSGWKMERLIEDVRAVCNFLQLDRVTLVGFGLGGNVAARFALEYPQRVRALVLMGTSAGPQDLWRRIKLHVLAGMSGLFGPVSALAAQAAKAMFSPGYRREYSHVVAAWSHALERMDPDVVRGMLRMFAERDNLLPRLPRLRELRLPVLLLAGTQDELVSPGHVHAVCQKLHGAQHQLLPGAGHAIPLERPEATLAALRRFLIDSGVMPPEHLEARAA